MTNFLLALTQGDPAGIGPDITLMETPRLEIQPADASGRGFSMPDGGETFAKWMLSAVSES